MQRGQIFSLDFIISMVVITAAIALLIQATEFNTYNMKEERIYNEMRNTARIAANLIVSSNETTCSDGTGGHLMNCVDTGGNFVPIDDFLTASGYQYDISLLDVTGETSWNNNIDSDFVEIERQVLIDNLDGNPKDLTVRVWKA